jgi:hypothetical protein
MRISRKGIHPSTMRGGFGLMVSDLKERSIKALVSALTIVYDVVQSHPLKVLSFIFIKRLKSFVGSFTSFSTNRSR